MHTDEEIISRYFSRDEGAIAATSQKYGRQCYSVSFNILRVQEDAEEFVNETYLKVWNAIPPERPHDLKYYLIKIVRNVSLNRLKLNRLKFLSSKKRSRELEISLSGRKHSAGVQHFRSYRAYKRIFRHLRSR